METRANYLLVGIFVILAVTAIFMFFIWLAGGPNHKQYMQVMIHFPGSVSGLSEGSQVRYRGVQVGNVAKISLDPNAPDQVHVLVNILKTTPLREDMRADLQMQGITGLSFIELTGYSATAAPLKAKLGQKYPVIHGSESALEKVMENIPELIQSYSKVADSILAVLTPENRKNFTENLKQLDEFTKMLADSRQEFSTILFDTQEVVKNFKEFSQAGLIELEYFLRDTRRASKEVGELSHTLRTDPSSLLFQPSYEGYQIE